MPRPRELANVLHQLQLLDGLAPEQVTAIAASVAAAIPKAIEALGFLDELVAADSNLEKLLDDAIAKASSTNHSAKVMEELEAELAALKAR